MICKNTVLSKPGYLQSNTILSSRQTSACIVGQDNMSVRKYAAHNYSNRSMTLEVGFSPVTLPGAAIRYSSRSISPL